MSKNILQSKTFWLNVLGIAALVGGVLPPKYGGPLLGVVNILNRLQTSQPVTVLPSLS